MIGKNAIEKLNTDEILDSLGLMRKSEEGSWLWPALGGVCVGLLCGVGLGLAFAPKKGSELRDEIGGKLKNRDFAGIGETARNAIGGTSGSNINTGNAGRGSTVI